MIPVQSSNLLEIGWAPSNDAQTEGDLHVTFTDGSGGFYQGVPLDVFREMRDGATSKGSFLHTHIIKQGYNFVRNPPPGEAQ